MKRSNDFHSHSDKAMANIGKLRLQELGFEWPDTYNDDMNDFAREPRPPKVKRQRFKTVSAGDIELSVRKFPLGGRGLLGKSFKSSSLLVSSMNICV